MGSRDPRIDVYIAKAAPFARPILTHLRGVVHATLPDVEETMKWSVPHFMHHGMLAGMAAFKQHCAFGFWKGRLVVETAAEKEAMGQFGCLRTLEDLPADRQLKGWLKKAAALNESGEKVPRPLKHAKRPALRTPADLIAALAKNAKARKTFEGFSPSNRREYVEWITDAKRDETRTKRLAQAVEWMAEGKSRNWKYA